MRRPSKAEVAKRERAIRRALEAQRAELPDDVAKDSEVDVVVNSDGSVDGQLRVKGLGRGDDLRRLLIGMEGGARKQRPASSWISVGFRFPGDERVRPENYARWAGRLQAQLYYQRATEEKLPHHFTRARKVLKWLAKAGRRKPTEIFVRLRWAPDMKQPQIPASRRGKGRYKKS